MTEHFTVPGRACCGKGFTLIELLLVLTLIGILASITVPVVNRAVVQAKEAALKENLFTIRKAIDDYYADKGKYPESLQTLVDSQYIRFIPEEPFLKDREAWKEVYSTDSDVEGMVDVFSDNDKVATDGSTYGEW